MKNLKNDAFRRKSYNYFLYNIKKLLNHFKIYNIDKEIKDMTIEIRKNYGIKLPDSIICATALVSNSILISNDKQLSKIDGLDVLSLERSLNC